MVKQSSKKYKKKRLGTMDKILILIGIAIMIFVVVMIWLFIMYQTIPDTLCTCFFGACVGECGVMSWIKTTKERTQERKYELQDKKKEEQL